MNAKNATIPHIVIAKNATQNTSLPNRTRSMTKHHRGGDKDHKPEGDRDYDAKHRHKHFSPPLSAAGSVQFDGLPDFAGTFGPLCRLGGPES